MARDTLIEANCDGVSGRVSAILQSQETGAKGDGIQRRRNPEDEYVSDDCVDPFAMESRVKPQGIDQPGPRRGKEKTVASNVFPVQMKIVCTGHQGRQYCG